MYSHWCNFENYKGGGYFWVGLHPPTPSHSYMAILDISIFEYLETLNN